MPEVNKANRRVCDLLINILSNMKPFLKFDTANVTTVGLSSDSVHAMAKGSRRIAFNNPLDGTMSVEAQVYPFKFFSLFSDGTIDNSATYADTQTITCDTAGELSLKAVTGGTIDTGTVFAFPEDSFGDESKLITGTFVNNKFTAAADSTNKIEKDNTYTVGYVVNRTGVKKISFNNKKVPQDYFITMSTLDKDENGQWTPFVMTAYKATIQRNFELSFSSEGDPATVKATFDLLEDKNGNVLDFIEMTEDETESTDTE